MTSADLLNKFLKAKYDTSDPIYKALISDSSGVESPTVNIPADFNIGAIAGSLEWIRQLDLYLKNQLQLDTSSGMFFKLITEQYINITAYPSEIQADLVNRIISFILDPKISEASIIKVMIPYSSPGLPEILTNDEQMYADASFSDNYSSFQNTTPGIEFGYWVMAAIAGNGSAFEYFFILRLENTSSSDIMKVIDIMSRWVAAGIEYEIRIVEV